MDKYSELLQDGKTYALGEATGQQYRAELLEERGKIVAWLLSPVDKDAFWNEHIWIGPGGGLFFATTPDHGDTVEFTNQAVYFAKAGWEPEIATWEDLWEVETEVEDVELDMEVWGDVL